LLQGVMTALVAALYSNTFKYTRTRACSGSERGRR
jgi:hypothetical protein